MARFGRMFALGSGDGKTVPTKTCPSSLHRLSRTLSAEKKRVPLRFFTFPVKSTRVLFKEIALSGKCKNTVICGIKSMSNTANVENAGSINNPPGCFGFDHSRAVAAVVVNLVVLAAYLTASTILFPVVFVIFLFAMMVVAGFSCSRSCFSCGISIWSFCSGYFPFVSLIRFVLLLLFVLLVIFVIHALFVLLFLLVVFICLVLFII